MTPTQQMRAWLIGALAFLALVWLFSDILLPFVVGMAVAYFLDPVADRLEAAGLSRTGATVLITVGFVVLLVAALFVVAPVLETQVRGFIGRVPGYVEGLAATVGPLTDSALSTLGADQVDKIKDAIGGQVGTAASWMGGLLKRLISGGVALFNLISLLVITPVVTFYMLRDWDRMVAKVDDWLPRRHLGALRGIARDIDTTLAGFVRGQGTVCLVLGLTYGIGLSLVGLDIGLLVGLGAGLISFIPYVGSIAGFVVGVGLAIAQFQDIAHPLIVAGIFGVGQVLEGNVLTPKLVGEKVGLHAVWVIFALMAGGSLFGLLGMLLAVPVAAVIGVLARFGLERYRHSALYTDAPAHHPVAFPDEGKDKGEA